MDESSPYITYLCNDKCGWGDMYGEVASSSVDSTKPSYREFRFSENASYSPSTNYYLKSRPEKRSAGLIFVPQFSSYQVEYGICEIRSA
ncbi:hypothetical protein F0562_028687 [Nyssa sinensis]|uniref:Uncharacterized protein n=1 Tax=Nyssa sinensis TaxID=561372 RepID=A0A5J5B0M9_9ASTE|nr:hypothetical protein F0562_028687 [Nyssa sinensis]